MTGPASPKGWPRTPAAEVRSDRDQFAMRLASLGASVEEIAATMDRWDDLDDDWTPDRRHYLATAAGDTELAGLIRDARDEYEVGTVTEEAAAERAEQVSYRAASDEAGERIGGTIAAVMAWVGDDPVRALAVLDLERSDAGAGRVTMIAQLEELIGGT